MNCICTASSLRLFIRGVAQVDIPRSTRLPVKRQINDLRTRSPWAGQTRISRRVYSTSPSTEDYISSEHTSMTQAEVESKLLEAEDGGQNHDDGIESAFVDFSRDAVAAIAAETAPSKAPEGYETSMGPAYSDIDNGYETPLKSLLKDIPRKEGHSTEDFTTVTRRTHMEDKSFASHYSSSRKRLPTSDTSSRVAFKGKFGLQDTEKLETPATETEWKPRKRENWQIDKEALTQKFPDGWNPLKKLSPDAIAGVRALHAQTPEYFTTERLAQEFEVSPEAVRRILKSKWRPNSEEETERRERWFKRGQQVWGRYAEMGMKPPRTFRDLGIGQGKPEWLKRKQEEPRVERSPRRLPALITTARRREAKAATAAGAGLDSLAGKIL